MKGRVMNTQIPIPGNTQNWVVMLVVLYFRKQTSKSFTVAVTELY